MAAPAVHQRLRESACADPASAAALDSYLERSGCASALPASLPAAKLAEHRVRLAAAIAAARASPEGTAVSWEYRVPELGQGGACSRFGHLQAEPFDLAARLGGICEATRALLAAVTAAKDDYRAHSKSDWFGIYQARQDGQDGPGGGAARSLVKLAYFGSESRAEFPLTEEFAQLSNNSSVGLSGRARLVNDVDAYVAGGGEYYTCDPKVKAEACFPIFGAGGVVGILDSEACATGFFDADELALLLAVAVELSASGALG